MPTKEDAKEMIVLSGDVGGTNTRLQLTKNVNGVTEAIVVKKYLAAEYKSLSDVIRRFLKEAKLGKEEIKAASLAVAGPVKNGAIEFTNLPWAITEKELAEVLSLPLEKVKLINDFASIGYGLESLKTSELVCLQQAPIDENAPIVMVGAGTGLGMGVVTKVDGVTHVYPSEGGHQDFAPVNDEQIELFQFLKKKLHRVSIERICCGPGLVNIYHYVVANPLYNQPESPELRRDMHRGLDQAQLITKYAIEKGDPMALRALDIFISVYGAVAGNMALATLPRQGLYIVGGIAPKLIDQIKDGRFINMFNDKGRMSGLMKEIPVYVVMNTDAGLNGAAKYAEMLCKK
ncbi:glucokinase [Fangia hongkongensis]|uniref:glucokinase n=1 Tax=Fangia hongkongensis TaxID=270495 RepID=UPI000374DD25|nr:glucokinase [Fangia hongkongensis]